MSLLRYCMIVLVAFSPALLHAEGPFEEDFSLDSLLAVPVSTAAKYRQTVAEAPASISVITATDIERFHYRTLADVLNRVRGISVTNDRNYTYAGVRGFGRPSDNNDRILLLVDGHTFNENVYGSGLIGSEFGFSLDAVERIEIVRGPGSALYGTGAMFGVVNVIMKDYQSMDGLRAAGSLGSYGHRNASLAYGTEIAHGGGIFVSANVGRQDGTEIYFPEYDAAEMNNGVASGVDWDTYYGITAKVTLPHLVLQSGFTAREKGIPTASFLTNFNDPRAQTKDIRQFADLLYARPVRDALQISVRLYGDRYYYSGAYPYDILSTDESTGLWWGSEARVQW